MLLAGLTSRGPPAPIAQWQGFLLGCGRLGFDSWSDHTSDLKLGDLVDTRPDAWWYGVSAGTGWPDVSNSDWGIRKFDLQLCNSAKTKKQHKKKKPTTKKQSKTANIHKMQTNKAKEQSSNNSHHRHRSRSVFDPLSETRKSGTIC